MFQLCWVFDPRPLSYLEHCSRPPTLQNPLSIKDVKIKVRLYSSHTQPKCQCPSLLHNKHFQRVSFKGCLPGIIIGLQSCFRPRDLVPSYFHFCPQLCCHFYFRKQKNSSAVLLLSMFSVCLLSITSNHIYHCLKAAVKALV